MKEIKLSQGFTTHVDDEDYEYLSQFKWHVKLKRNIPYAAGWVLIGGNRIYTYMHRLLLNPKKKELIDHRDSNPLNNTKNNLRICTRSQKKMNSKQRGNFTSKYKGVGFSKSSNKWQARIVYRDNRIFLGYFLKEEDAAKAYDAKAKMLYGEFANLNF